MADISHHQFVTLLKKSKVVEPKKLQPWLEKTKKIESARKLAKSLVKEKMLTIWQAKFLLSGRYRLRIGNYFLLSRLRRDELGARYLAVHASLERKVELQIFSRDLTSDTQRWKDMIQKASLVAKLDHPALVHVYDIDHDDDRYFLVVEHVAGRPLDVQKEIFTTPQIGKLVLQCAEGIEVAHQHKVVHGTIDQTDILLTDKGTVKLQNLTVSPMRNLNSDAPEAKPVADYVAMAVLGEEIVKANPGADGGSGIGLSAILELMKSDGPKSIKKLKQWVEATPDAAAAKAEVTKSGANPIFSPTAGSSSGVDLSKTPSASVDVGEGDDSAAAASSTSIIEAAKSSRPFLIAIAIGALLFCGIVITGIVRGYEKFIGEPSRLAVVATEEKEDLAAKRKAAYSAKEKKAFDTRQAKEAGQAKEARQTKEKPSGNAANQPKGPKKRKTAAQKRAAARQSKNKNGSKKEPNNQLDPKQQNKKDRDLETVKDVVASETKPDETKPDEAGGDEVKPSNAGLAATEPAAEPSKFMDIFSQRKTETSGEPDEKTAGAKKTADAGIVPPTDLEPDSLTKLTGIGPATEKVLRKGGVITYEQIVKMKPADLDTVLDEGGAKKLGKKWSAIIEEAKPLAEVSLEKAKDHFRKVPELFELPAIDSTETKKLTELLIPANYSLSTELVSPQGVSPRKTFFELNEASGGETWTVAVKKSKTAPQSNDIATITKTFDALNFAWLPEAAEDKSAGYLRNCLLRLSTPDGRSAVSKLRKPIQVRSLRINKDKIYDSLKLEIEGAPDSDRMQIQLGALQNRERTVEVIDPSCTIGSPALVALKRRETKGQFLALQVAVERSGGGIKLHAGLVLSNGKLLKSVKELANFQNKLSFAVETAQQRLASAENNNNKLPRNKRINTTDMKKEVSVAQGNLNRMNDYSKSIEWLFEGGGGIGEAINFDIAANFDDGRITLVKSNKNLVDEDKKKKK